MIKKIIHDVHFLSQKSFPATPADIQAVQDLKATFVANCDRAAGLAANMIGIHKRIIVFGLGKLPVMMINPKIVAQNTPYQTTEGCLSLDGVRPTQRFKHITVKFQNEQFQWQTQDFTDLIAEVIQHEIDHCNGILI